MLVSIHEVLTVQVLFSKGVTIRSSIIGATGFVSHFSRIRLLVRRDVHAKVCASLDEVETGIVMAVLSGLFGYGLLVDGIGIAISSVYRLAQSIILVIFRDSSLLSLIVSKIIGELNIKTAKIKKSHFDINLTPKYIIINFLKFN